MSDCPCPHHPIGCYGHPHSCRCATGRVVAIKLQRREDGGLRIYSDQIPGLILSGNDPRKVMADLWPALEGLNVHALSLGE